MSSTGQDTHGTSMSQEDSTQSPTDVSLADIAKTLNGILAVLSARLPAVLAGALYLEEQLQANCHASDTTINRWEQSGAPAKKPATKHKFYRGDDVLAVMEKPSSEIAKYIPRTDDARKAFLKRKPKKKAKPKG